MADAARSLTASLKNGGSFVETGAGVVLASNAACVVLRRGARRALPYRSGIHPPPKAGRNSRHDIPVDKTYRDRCRRRAGAGDRGHGSHGCNEPGSGRTIEHRAPGRLGHTGDRQGADDHATGRGAAPRRFPSPTSGAAATRPAETAPTSPARPTTTTSRRRQTAATRCAQSSQPRTATAATAQPASRPPLSPPPRSRATAVRPTRA